jgi:hypothetical protein
LGLTDDKLLSLTNKTRHLTHRIKDSQGKADAPAVELKSLLEAGQISLAALVAELSTSDRALRHAVQLGYFTLPT